MLDQKEIFRLMEQHPFIVNFNYVCEHCQLTEEDIEKYKEFIDCKYLIKNKFLSDDFFMKNFEIFAKENVLIDLLTYHQFSEQNILKIIKSLNNDQDYYIISGRTYYEALNCITQYQKLSEEFVWKNKRYFEFDYEIIQNLFMYQKLSEEFVNKHLKYFKTNDILWAVLGCQELSEKFLLKYEEYMIPNIEILLCSFPVSRSFISTFYKHFDEYNIEDLLDNNTVNDPIKKLIATFQ